MTPRFYLVLQEAIDQGIQRGWSVAHKHAEKPSEGTIKECIYNCVMGSLHEWFEFPSKGEDE